VLFVQAEECAESGVACRYFAGGKNLSADILRGAQKSLVARGGIVRGRLGHRHRDFQSLALPTRTNDPELKRLGHPSIEIGTSMNFGC